MGGNIFTDTKNGIDKEHVAATVSYFSKLAGIPVGDVVILGSAGKKAHSGDIDVGIDAGKYTAKEFAKIVDRLQEKLGEKSHKYTAGVDNNSFRVPIAGNPKNGHVQIDVFHNDIKYLEFSHIDVLGQRSQYKGFVRWLLLSSLATRLYEDGKDARITENGKMILDVRWGLDVGRGMNRIYRMCRMRKDGKGRISKAESVSPEDVRKEYPDLKFDGKARTIKNPETIAQKLFGKGVKAKQLESAENVIALIREKHPKLVEGGFFKQVAKRFKEEGLPIPHEMQDQVAGATPEIKSKSHGAATARTISASVSGAEEFSTACLPIINTEWRTFHQPGKGGKTKVFEVSIAADGQSFRFREGTLGKKLPEFGPVEFKDKGRPGSRTFESAAEQCQREVERRIQHRLANKFGELIDGEVRFSKYQIDFSKPFPRDFRTPKPNQYIEDAEFKRLHKEGLTRITRKYDGTGVTIVRHTYGWEVYTLNGNRITDFFPRQIEALEKQGYKTGTILKGESVMFDPSNPNREDFKLASATLNPARKPADVRRDIESGKVPEPRFVIYDALYYNGKDLGSATYDERKKVWEKLPVAHGDNGLLLSAEFYPKVTPDNWRDVRKKLGFEGFVVVDGSSTLGPKAITFSSAVPRPSGSYKLKPNREEDVVIYAVRQVDGEFQSVFVKQRYPEKYPGTNFKHPKAGEWFACGRVSIARKKDVLAKIEQLVETGDIEVVADNKEGEALPVNDSRGVVTVIEFFDRFPTNKFRHPKFAEPIRFRDEGADFKAVTDCSAAYLGTPAPTREKKKK